MDDGIDADLRMKLQSLLDEEKPEVLANAAMLGDVSTVREYLQKYPNDVCLGQGVLYWLVMMLYVHDFSLIG